MKGRYFEKFNDCFLPHSCYTIRKVAIDIAARFTSPRQLSDFRDKVDDLKKIPSLLLIDVVNLNSDMLSPALIDSIKKDGVVIFEKI